VLIICDCSVTPRGRNCAKVEHETSKFPQVTSLWGKVKKE